MKLHKTLFLLVLTLPLDAGCPRPGGAPGPNVVQCGTAAVTSCAAEVAGPVLACLQGPDSGACLHALIRPGASCLAYAGVACAVGDRAAVDDLNVPTGRMVGAVDEVVALRARAWLFSERIEFR